MCSCRGPSACKQGRRIYNTLLLQAMALYIHGPLRCKNLLGRIPNPHSCHALAAPQHAPGPRSDARSQRTPPGRSCADQQHHTPQQHRQENAQRHPRTHAAHTHTAQIRHPAAHAGSCAAPAAPHDQANRQHESPPGYTPDRLFLRPKQAMNRRKHPPRRASSTRHSVRRTARHFLSRKAQTRHIPAVSGSL